jgi:3-deoxy-manno-octulosonate cytidylyltransferase (CMP-KDO synthetase)
MNRLPDCYGIIPARYHSSRFPGKALADINGKPMFYHVFQRAAQCSLLKTIVLATDDDRILAAAKSLAVPVLMTDRAHPSGTDRVLEAAEMMQVPADSVIVNIQGDEPLLAPDMLYALLEPFSGAHVQATTLAKQIEVEEAQNPDLVKVVMAIDGRALYFSRAPIPFDRDGRGGDYFGHIGLYAFRMDILRRFQQLGKSRLESTESLEQLRLIENNIEIQVVVTEHDSHGVDRPEDLARILKMKPKDGQI